MISSNRISILLSGVPLKPFPHIVSFLCFLDVIIPPSGVSFFFRSSCNICCDVLFCSSSLIIAIFLIFFSSLLFIHHSYFSQLSYFLYYYLKSILFFLNSRITVFFYRHTHQIFGHYCNETPGKPSPFLRIQYFTWQKATCGQTAPWWRSKVIL